MKYEHSHSKPQELCNSIVADDMFLARRRFQHRYSVCRVIERTKTAAGSSRRGWRLELIHLIHVCMCVQVRPHFEQKSPAAELIHRALFLSVLPLCASRKMYQLEGPPVHTLGGAISERHFDPELGRARRLQPVRQRLFFTQNYDTVRVPPRTPIPSGLEAASGSYSPARVGLIPAQLTSGWIAKGVPVFRIKYHIRVPFFVHILCFTRVGPKGMEKKLCGTKGYGNVLFHTLCVGL